LALSRNWRGAARCRPQTVTNEGAAADFLRQRYIERDNPAHPA
jgi:hypothetical protein